MNYNCHSYAWYYACSYNSSDKMYIDDPWPYYASSYGNCYSPITSGPTLPSNLNTSTIQVGDIVCYIAYDDENYPTSNIHNYIHSATVTQKNGTTITVTSKNGQAGITTHAIAGGNYYMTLDGRIRKVQIYRRNHTISNSLPAGQNYQYVNNSMHREACHFCGRGTTLQYHQFEVSGSYRRCPCGYRIEIQNAP